MKECIWHFTMADKHFHITRGRYSLVLIMSAVVTRGNNDLKQTWNLKGDISPGGDPC